MSSELSGEKEAILVDVQLKNGKTVKVDIDELEGFWAANTDKIAITYSQPRRPRRSSTRLYSHYLV